MRQLHLQSAGVPCLAQSPESRAGTATVQAKHQGVQGSNNARRFNPTPAPPDFLSQQEQQSCLSEVLL